MLKILYQILFALALTGLALSGVVHVLSLVAVTFDWTAVPRWAWVPAGALFSIAVLTMYRRAWSQPMRVAFTPKVQGWSRGWVVAVYGSVLTYMVWFAALLATAFWRGKAGPLPYAVHCTMTAMPILGFALASAVFASRIQQERERAGKT